MDLDVATFAQAVHLLCERAAALPGLLCAAGAPRLVADPLSAAAPPLLLLGAPQAAPQSGRVWLAWSATYFSPELWLEGGGSADAEAAYLEARAGDVQALEAHIADLGSLFGRLAGLVAQQGEAVARIEDNAGSAAASVDAATLQLRRASLRADAGANGVVAMRVTVVVVVALVLFLLFG